MFKLSPIPYDPTPVIRTNRKRKRKVFNDIRQLCFSFMITVEERPRWLELWEIDPDACRALWYAVLKSGIESFMADIEDVSENDKHWIIYDHKERKRERIGSFKFCCSVLNIDSAKLRKKIIGV
jgi:hypothetical protein